MRKQTTTSQISAFPKLDAVIKRRQHSLRMASSFVTFALMLGAAGAVSSLAGCASDDQVETAGTPLPAGSDDEGLEAFRRDALLAIPDASFDLVARDAIDAATTRATIDVVGTLRAPFMGEDAVGSTVYVRVEVTTRHDRWGQARIVRGTTGAFDSPSSLSNRQ